MVESIGPTPLNAERGVTRIAAIVPTPVVASPASAPAATTRAGGIAQTLAASPPIDLDRIARIRKAIADNQFPILPATIADRLIALRLDWNGNHDAA